MECNNGPEVYSRGFPESHSVRNTIKLASALNRVAPRAGGDKGRRTISGANAIAAAYEKLIQDQWILISIAGMGIRFAAVRMDKIVLPDGKNAFQPSAAEVAKAVDEVQRTPSHNIRFSRRLQLAAQRMYTAHRHIGHGRICEAALLAAIEYDWSWNKEDQKWD